MSQITITDGTHTVTVADWKYAKLDKDIWKPVDSKESVKEIIEEAKEIEDKKELDEYAEEHGVELDRRQSKEDMVEDFEEKIQEVSEEGVPEDLICPHCKSKARTEKSYLKNHGANCIKNIKTK